MLGGTEQDSRGLKPSALGATSGEGLGTKDSDSAGYLLSASSQVPSALLYLP